MPPRTNKRIREKKRICSFKTTRGFNPTVLTVLTSVTYRSKIRPRSSTAKNVRNHHRVVGDASVIAFTRKTHSVHRKFEKQSYRFVIPSLLFDDDNFGGTSTRGRSTVFGSETRIPVRAYC